MNTAADEGRVARKTAQAGIALREIDLEPRIRSIGRGSVVVLASWPPNCSAFETTWWLCWFPAAATTLTKREMMIEPMGNSFSSLAVGIASLWVAGCGSPTDPPAAEVGAPSQLLVPDATGWVDRSATGNTGIQGQWHVYADTLVGVTGLPAEYCQTAGRAAGQCSWIDEPAPGSPYAPTQGLGMCISGVIAQWIANSDAVTPDGSPGWGGIALDLNMPDWPQPPANTPAPQVYNPEMRGVTGFAFSMSPEPGPEFAMRVVLTTVGRERKPAFWGGATARSSPVHAGRNEFTWNEVGGPPGEPASFDPTQLLRIGFLVSGSDARAVDYRFCIDDLTALQSSRDAPDAGSSADGGSVSPRRTYTRQPLVPNENGWVDRSTTGTTQIQGIWFAAADSLGSNGVPPGACQMAAHTECSMFYEPDPSAGTYSPTEDLGMCTSGVVAKNDGDQEIWGAMIGFIVNAADPPERRPDPYDAERYGVAGFAFDIDAEPPPGGEIKLELTTETGMQGSPAWWGGATADWSPIHAGHNEFTWSDVGGPNYIANPPPFNPRKLTEIGFHVASNPTRAVSYRFCIRNLAALLD